MPRSPIALPSGLAKLVKIQWPPFPEVSRLGPCWTWTGRSDAGGGRASRGKRYGRIGQAGRAHRVVYTILVRPLKRTEELDHLCVNTLCVAPHHVKPSSHRVNMRRLFARRR